MTVIIIIHIVIHMILKLHLTICDAYVFQDTRYKAEKHVTLEIGVAAFHFTRYMLIIMIYLGVGQVKINKIF